jgi:hypothetical protein
VRRAQGDHRRRHDVAGGRERQTELRVEAQAADDISGINEITLQFCDPRGKQGPILPQDIALTSGSATSGVWDGTSELSRYLPAGVYTVCFVNLSDKATNVVYLSKNARGTTLPSGAYAFDVVNDKNDTAAPVISNVTVSPSSVNVTNEPVTVTTDFTVIDDGSGVANLLFGLHENAFANPITTLPRVVSLVRTAGADVRTQTYTVHLTSARDDVTSVDLHVRSSDSQQWANGSFTLTSGTPFDGVWTATVQLPQNAEPGIGSVSSMSIDDSLGHVIPVLDPVVDGGNFTVS